MHGGSDGCAKIRRAECKEAESPMPQEFQFLLDFLDHFNESLVHRREVTISYHRYQTYVILLVTPDKKSFLLVKKYLRTWRRKQRDTSAVVLYALNFQPGSHSTLIAKGLLLHPVVLSIFVASFLCYCVCICALINITLSSL